MRLEVRDADTFIRLHFSNAESLDVTPHHIFTLADGSPMRAERLCLSDILVGRFGRVTLKRIEAISLGTPISRSVPFSSSVMVEARDFSPAKTSRLPRGGFSPGRRRPPRPGSSCSADISPAFLPSTQNDAPWQKVTISCEPSHQFFAGRHSASILTHNYTFSS